jgi:phosphotransferase system enzyme I (PtsI)
MRLKFKTERSFSGLSINGGVVLAKVCLFNEKRHSNLPDYKISPDNVEHEKSRLRQALKVAAGQLESLKTKVAEDIGAAEAEIFVAQKMILEDVTLNQQIIETIEKDYYNCEQAIIHTYDIYESRLSELDNEYIRERVSDFGEIKRRLLDALGNINPSLQCENEEHCQRGRNRVVIAQELTPTLTLELDSEHIMGLVTERGGRTSHAAIFARALGIPAVSGIKEIHSLSSCGAKVLVNGDTGEVIFWPTEETLSRYPEVKIPVIKVPLLVNPTPELKVMANISLASEVGDAKAMNSEGIGLYRTEYEFMATGRILDE